MLLCLLTLSSAYGQFPGSSNSPFARQPAFLEVDEAFRFYASLDSNEQISIHWDIAPGYYLYADKFSFRITEPEDIAGSLIPKMPAGTAHEDEFFGKVTVYYTQTSSQLQLPYDSPAEFTLEIGFQGCADAGLCYPPTLRHLEILR